MSWLEWLRHLAPLRPPDNRVLRSVWEQTVLVPLAEALELAAPQGPRGCPMPEDHGAARAAARLLVDMLQAELRSLRGSVPLKIAEMTEHGVEQLQAELAAPLALDLAGQPVPSLLELQQLARVNTEVSPQSAGVAVARARYPKTWEVLESWTR